jgi:hypothetical protein
LGIKQTFVILREQIGAAESEKSLRALNLAAVHLDNAFRDGQPQAGTPFLRVIWRPFSWISSNKRTFSIAIAAWSAKVDAVSICLSVNGRT